VPPGTKKGALKPAHGEGDFYFLSTSLSNEKRKREKGRKWEGKELCARRRKKSKSPAGTETGVASVECQDGAPAATLTSCKKDERKAGEGRPAGKKGEKKRYRAFGRENCRRKSATMKYLFRAKPLRTDKGGEKGGDLDSEGKEGGMTSYCPVRNSRQHLRREEHLCYYLTSPRKERGRKKEGDGHMTEGKGNPPFDAALKARKRDHPTHRWVPWICGGGGNHAVRSQRASREEFRRPILREPGGAPHYYWGGERKIGGRQRIRKKGSKSLLAPPEERLRGFSLEGLVRFGTSRGGRKCGASIEARPCCQGKKGKEPIKVANFF